MNLITILRSNGGFISSVQGLILEATAQTYARRKPVPSGQVDQQAGSIGLQHHSGSSFNRRVALNNQPHRSTVASSDDDGKRLEDAFWKNKQIERRKITSADVLAAYGNERTSLRGGFFLQKLCLQHILHNNGKITPEQVIQEFNRRPDRNNKYQLAIARFKAECCLRSLLVNGQKVTPDAVVKDFPESLEGKLGIARFKEQCFRRGLPLNGQEVTPDAVVEGFQTAKVTLELARFKEKCCFMGLLLNGQQVTPDGVVKGYQAAGAILELVRFKEICCLRGLLLSGQQVTPDAVVKDYQAVRATLELARFKEECCLRGLLLNGRTVTPDAVVKDFQAAKATLDLVRFKAECCLRELSLNGQQVTPDAVVKDFPESPEGKLGIARFKEQCCMRGLSLNGQQVPPDAVAKGFQAARATLELARFKAECCLRGLPLTGQQVTPDAVVKGFQAARATLELARFKAECCLRRLPLNGQQVTPDTVVKDFPKSPEGRLGIARFKERCCLMGLSVNGRQVTPDAVVKDFPESLAGKLGIARFKEGCCLRGLLLNGQQVTPDVVVKDFPESREGKLGIARFKGECCLRGLPLNGQQITPDAVVKDYQAAKAILDLARFKGECCLRGLPLNGQQVTSNAVVKDYQAVRATLELARFKEDCCLRGLLLNGRKVTPDAVVKDYQAARAALELVRFKEQCCLRGLPLDGQQVTPDSVVKDYERGGWLFEKAMFYSLLALSARELNGCYLDNEEVLEAFNEVPSDHSSRQAEYLVQRLKQPQWYDETSEAQDVFQQAWQILGNVSVKNDEHYRLQCILKFMAMQYEFPIDHQKVSAEQVLQSIKTLRNSFQNSRLHFFFLAQCYITSRSIDGREIHKEQVLECLQSFPEGSKLRHALGCWFEQCSCEANIMDELLFKRENAVFPRLSVNRVNNKADNTSVTQAVTTGTTQSLKPWLKTGEPGCPDQQVSQLNSLTMKALEIIQEINDFYTDPAILITGSFARFLQNLCLSFKDIDIICTTEESARTLGERLRALNIERDSEIQQRVTIWPIPGCPEIKLPKAYSIDLTEGDLATKAMALQVSVDARVTQGKLNQVPLHVPGVKRPVKCLLFAEETRLLNDTLEYLAENLDPLTEQLQKGAVFDIPRTILFNFPQNSEERIYGLFMRCLFTLNKARQFNALLCEGKTGYQPDPLYEEQQRLHVLTKNLQIKLLGHACRDDFERRVNGWLSTAQHENDYEIKRKEFIKILLAMMGSE